MNLKFIKYNNQYYFIIDICHYDGKLVSILIMKMPNKVYLNDNTIARIRKNKNTFDKENNKGRIKLLKEIVPNFNNIFRTFKIDKCKILYTYDLLSL